MGWFGRGNDDGPAPRRAESTPRGEDPRQELLAALPDAAGVVDREGRFRLANGALDALSSSGRAAGATALELLRSVELAEAIRRVQGGWRERLEIQLPANRRTLLAWVTPLGPDEALVVLRDVTDAKRAEAARRDFVANASHELRTPVAAIRGAAETLLGGALASPDDARPFLAMIVRHAERITRLTQDLLDLSRIESGQWAMRLDPLELEPVARTVLGLHGETAAARRQTLRCEVAPDLRVLADPRALEQVLVNLVDNAVKYTPEGGHVTIRAARQGDRIVVTVEDDGPGIERHHLPRLFERFYRVDAGRSREAGGTGLGLAIVKHLAQAQGGEVGVESGAGGSRFWVRLRAG